MHGYSYNLRGWIMKPLSSTRVAWIYVFGFLSIMIFAALWWPFSQAVSYFYTTLSGLYASDMNDPAIAFINALWTYGPPLVLFAILIWNFVNSQKQRGVYT